MEKTFQSRLIDAIRYDDETRHLRVYLKSGQLRDYEDVPKGVVVGLGLAASPGSFFNSEIRGKYSQH